MMKNNRALVKGVVLFACQIFQSRDRVLPLRAPSRRQGSKRLHHDQAGWLKSTLSPRPRRIAWAVVGSARGGGGVRRGLFPPL